MSIFLILIIEMTEESGWRGNLKNMEYNIQESLEQNTLRLRMVNGSI